MGILVGEAHNLTQINVIFALDSFFRSLFHLQLRATKRKQRALTLGNFHLLTEKGRSNERISWLHTHIHTSTSHTVYSLYNECGIMTPR